MKPIILISQTAVITIIVIALTIYDLNAQGFKKNIISWKGKSIEVAQEQIVIKVQQNISQDELKNKIQFTGYEIINGPDDMGLALLKIPKGKSIQEAIQAIQTFSEIKGAEPVVATRVSVVPNDQYYGNQWGLTKISASSAWDITTGNSNVIIGVLDSGIPIQNNSLSHPDLQNSSRIILGNDYTGDGQGVRDRNGHGTHVIGIASGETNNSTGISGVSWNTRIFVVQVFDSLGSGYDYYFYQGVRNAVDNGARVINFSGGQTVSSYYAEAGVQYARNNGCLIVAAAGNYDQQHNPNKIVEWPAAYSTSYDNVIAVSATNSNDVIADFSSRGPEINVAAPGNWIYSALPNYPNYQGSQNYYYLSGTSMAAPHVAGLAALIKSFNSSLTPSQIRTIIQLSADDKGTPGFDNLYGYGRINANTAVRYLYVPQVYSAIQSAANIAVNGQTIQLASGYFNENVTVNAKNNLTIRGQGRYNTIINGNLSFNSCDGLELYDFDCNKISASYCDGARLYCEVNGIPSQTGVYLYICSDFLHWGTIFNNATGLTASFSDGATHSSWFIDNGTSLYTNLYSDVIAYYGSRFCESINLDLNAYQAHIAAIGCYYRNGNPRYSTSGGGTINFYPPYNNCSLSKNNTVNEEKDFLLNSELVSDDPVEVEFSNINLSYFNLLQTIKEEAKENGLSNNRELHDQYLQIIKNFKDFYKRNPKSTLSKVALTTTVSSLRRFNYYNEMKAVLDEIIADNNLILLRGLAEVFVIDYFKNIKDFDTAINIADVLIKNYENESDNSELCNLLLKKGFILAYELQQPEKAAECFSTIINNYSDNSLAELAKNELEVLGINGEIIKQENSNASSLEFSTSSFPNPFNPVTTINYILPVDEKVVIKVYDILGREISELVNEVKTAGKYSVSFDAKNLSSGVYFYTISAGNFHQTQKIVLTK